MSKKKTQELQGMPEMDSTGKLAAKLSEIDDVLSEKKAEREQIALELSAMLKMTGRTRIQLEDRVYVLKASKAVEKIVAVKVKPASSTSAATHASKTERE